MQKAKKIIHKWSWVLLLTFCILGLIYPAIGIFAIVCMLAPIVIAFFKGRLWCGNFCPRGSFNDIILSKISLKKHIPQFMKTDWFKLLFLIVLMSFFAVQIFFAWGSILAVGKVFVRMIIITTLLAIALGIFYNQRIWCTICPMGTMAHYISKTSFSKKSSKHISFKDNSCIDCKACTKNCPMNISVHLHKNKGEVLDGNCLKCNVCISKCPKKALYIA